MRDVRRVAFKLLITVGLACVFTASALWGQAVLTWHNDLARTGQDLVETVLAPSNVNSTNFGLLALLGVDGLVDAQPLYVPSVVISAVKHNVVYVVTENDTLYAFDADTFGTPPVLPLWSLPLLGASETASDSDNGCGQVGSEVGITSTPAIDLTQGPNGTIYVVAMTKDNSGHYHDRLHAVDLATGAEQSGWPIEVAATFPNIGGTVTFVPQNYKERAALLISNGIIYTTWASNCDAGTYYGWVIGYNQTTQAQVILNLTPNGSDGAIWQAGAGPAADAGGNLYFLMANGTFDAPPPVLTAGGFPAHGDYGNAFMNLSTINGVTVQDYFTMHNTVDESNGDQDLGSGGAILLPTLNDALGKPHALAVGAGKDGNAYVVDRNNMGKFNASSNAVYQQFGLGGGVFSSPAWFNNTLYYGAVGQPIRSYPYSGGSFGSASSHTSASFGYPGATPSISANGSANGIVWAVDSSSSTLYALDASNLNELYDSTQAGSRDSFGSSTKFATPTVANGKVYVGTSNSVAVFGLLCSYLTHTTNTSSTTGYVTVTTTSGCSWSVANTSDFIILTGATSGTGNGTVNFQVPANPGPSRSGVLVIADQLVTISQGGGTITSGLGFYPLTPCRIVDTRTGSGLTGPFGAPSLAALGTRSFPVPASFCNAPASSLAYSANVTAVVPSGGKLGYLTSWPAGQTLPAVATLNAPNGGVVGNAAIVPAGVDHAISFYASNATNLVVDVNGYFGTAVSPQALAFYPVTPCRLVDTRTGSGFTGAFGAPALVGGTSRNFPVQNSCGIPSTALAYSMRMTAIASGALSYLTAYPAGGTQPVAATLNAPNGGVIGNEAIVPAGTGDNGPISVYASNNTNVVIDINGYFAPPGGAGALYFYPMTPCRVADTRSGSGFGGSFGQPSLLAGQSRDFPIQSSACSIPSTARAYSLNLTAIVPSNGSSVYLTAYPTGESVPVAATVNATAGGVVGSAAIVPANASTGDISVFASNATDLVIDVNGYFAP